MTMEVVTESLGAAAAVHNMNALSLFWQADIVVKFVMLLLLGCSFWTWAIIIHKRSLLAGLNHRANRFEDSFWSGEPLDKIYAAGQEE